MAGSTRILVSTFGALVSLAGIEHGLGEALQGSTPPSGFMFPSWPGSAFFSVLGGEPAASLIPNLLFTGILAILVSLAYGIWAAGFAQRKRGGLVLTALAVLMFLLGGGIFPPVFGLLIAAAAARIHPPQPRWAAKLSGKARRFSEKAWPWAFGASVAAWLAMIPGVPALSYFFSIENDNLILLFIACMFGFLIAALVTGFIRDARGQAA